MNITISPLNQHPEAIPKLVKLLHESICKIWSPTDTIEEIQTWFNEWTNDHIPLAFIALNENTPIGMCSLLFNDGIRPDLKPWLGDLCVDPNYRNSGVGNKLIEAAKQKAKEEGFSKLYLFAPDPNVLSYYYKLGWMKFDSALYQGKVVTIFQINL